MSTVYNTIVLGLGAMGSAALYQLARRGDSVLGIDQYDPPHTLGSTHGGSRITRQAIGEGLEYTPLSLRSYEIIKEIEEKTGEKLLLQCGGLMISNKAATGVHHVQNFFEVTVQAARKFNIPHEELDAEAVRKRFPVFNIRDNEYAYFEPGAGLLYPEKVVATQLKLAKEAGASVRTNELVVQFEQERIGKELIVKVTTDKGTYLTRNLIVSAGPWLPELLNLSYSPLANLFQVVRQVMFWFDIEEVYDQFKPENFPIFIWESAGDEPSSYGMPAIDGPKGGFKIASPKFNGITTPGLIERQVSEEEVEAERKELLETHFPSAGRRLIKSAVCMYTDTKDSHFIMGRLPGQENIILASPCSGHGFKHSPAIGECLAQLVLDGKTKLDTDAFSIESAYERLTADLRVPENLQIPTEEDWGNPNGDLDWQYAKDQLCGRDLQYAADRFRELPLALSEDLDSMPEIPFRFYIHATTLAFKTLNIRSDWETHNAANGLLSVVATKLRQEPEKILPVMQDMLPTLEFISENQGLLDADVDIYGLFKAEYREISELAEQKSSMKT